MKPQTYLRILAICTVALLVLPSASATNTIPAQTGNPCSGSYVDKVVYSEFGSEGATRIALENGEIDAIRYGLSQSDVNVLETNPDIEI